MGKKTKTPEAPDYTRLAQQQAQQGQQAWNAALQANRPNQSNQFGNLTWSQDPTTGAWTQSNQLNQPQQDIFNQQQANQQQIANMGGGMLGGFDTSQIDLSGAPQMPGVSDYGSLGDMPQVGQYSQQATDLYNQLMAPQLAQQRSAQEAKLAAMGLNAGSGKAWENAQRAIGTNENQAALQAAQAGIQQGNTMFGQAMQGRQQGVNELNNQFTQGSQLHQQGVSDILAQRGANLQQLSGLMGLGQSVGTPQYNSFQATNPYQTADLMGAAQGQYGAQMNTTNAANADKANTMKTVGTVGSLAAMAF